MTTTKPSELIHTMLLVCRQSSESWAERHHAAWLQSGVELVPARQRPFRKREVALRKLIVGWSQLGETHADMYDSPIGDDGVLGPAFAQMGRGILDMLNGECGRFDCGTLDRLIREIARACNVMLDDDAVAFQLRAGR